VAQTDIITTFSIIYWGFFSITFCFLSFNLIVGPSMFANIKLQTKLKCKFIMLLKAHEMKKIFLSTFPAFDMEKR
jgi:hypothetical protein